MKYRNIIVGVTGGIATYKTCTLVSSLKKQGHTVHVLMSANAQKFVSPLTFQTLSGQKVYTDMFSTDYEPDVHHISLAKEADLFVIAPASADVIAKIANGIADDMLTTTFLASRCEKLLVPAMNTGMLDNPATQRNLEICRNDGIHILESDSGYLACGDTGRGRMPEAEEIEDAIKMYLCTDRPLTGRKILITAGPTRESIDPVRYITNHSSGKMGYALARAARNAGADVTLINGPVALQPLYGVSTVSVESADEMYQAVMNHYEKNDTVIMAAAVADYRPALVNTQKIKKEDGDLSLTLMRTPDILKEVSSHRKAGQTIIGFAMETEDLLNNARKKCIEKNCDYIIANSISEKGAGFQGDTNIVTIISKDATVSLPLLSKDEAAVQILKHCLSGKKGSKC